MAAAHPAAAATRTAAPTWARPTLTHPAAARMNPAESQPTPTANAAPDPASGAALLAANDASGTVPVPAAGTPEIAAVLAGASAFVVAPVASTYRPAAETPPLPPLPQLRSEDGRFTLTDTTLTVRAQEFLLRELERAEVTPVKWILWYLLGGLGLAFVMIVYLQNGLRTGPAMLGMALTGLLLAYGHRGTNRLRLYRLGREVVNFALPGETPPWQRLTAELNRRIFRLHDDDARRAAAELAAHDETVRQAALSAQTTEAGWPAPGSREPEPGNPGVFPA